MSDPSTQEPESGGLLQVWGQSELYIEFCPSSGYRVRPVSKQVIDKKVNKYYRASSTWTFLIRPFLFKNFFISVLPI